MLQKPKQISTKIIKNLLLALAITVFSYTLVSAAPPPGSTTAPYIVSYSAKLADAGGTPITATQSVRFSLWTDSDVDATDFLGSGAIDPVAGGFTGWEEIHTVTPDSLGIFHVQLGSITTLPNFTEATHKFIQIDVKPVADPLTSFETLDPDGSTANLDDRHPLTSASFAINSDTVDGADVGTGPGNIPVLDGSSFLPVSTIPGGTNTDTFVLDSDDSVAAPDSILLQFGATLAKALEYDLGDTTFKLNDSLAITGDLSATGNIDFSSATEYHIREVADEAAATCTTVNEMVLDTTETRIYVCTAPGAPGTWAATGSSAYDQSIVIEPEFEDGVVSSDGSANRGKLEIFYEDTDGSPGNANINYYRWTTRNVAIQDIDLILRIDLPDGFTGFQATPLEVTYRTSDGVVATNHLDVEVEDTAGSSVTLVGGTGLASAAFSTAGITFGGVPAFTAGEEITIKIKLNSTSAGFADLGKVSLNYTGL